VLSPENGPLPAEACPTSALKTRWWAGEGWCLELVSSQPLRVFGAALSPDQLPRQSAHRSSARELARTRRIELLSPEWRSGIEPINYIRVAHFRCDLAGEGWCVPEDSNLSSADLPVS
jgi:hypothetical protein